jgi:DnaD/phage-associated family protein
VDSEEIEENVQSHLWALFLIRLYAIIKSTNGKNVSRIQRRFIIAAVHHEQSGGGFSLNYHINFTNYKNNFSLPRLIVDEIQDIPSDYLKIILMIFKDPDKNYSVHLLSQLLNIQEEKISQAISYWIDKQVLAADTEATAARQPQVHMVTSKLAVPVQPCNDPELKYLLSTMEQIMERPLTSTDMKTITHIYEYYRLPADVIVMAIQYSVKNGKKDIRYIEKVCISWYDQGITTHTAAETFLKHSAEYHAKEGQVKKLLGIADRKLIPSEEKWIRTWLEEYQFSLDVLQLAYERTVKNTGKAAMAYMNKILSNWNEKGYRTVREINQKDGGKKYQASDTEQSYDIDLLDRYWDNVPTLD